MALHAEVIVNKIHFRLEQASELLPGLLHFLFINMSDSRSPVFTIEMTGSTKYAVYVYFQ